MERGMDVRIRIAEPEDFRQVHALVTLPEVADVLGELPTDDAEGWRRRLESPSPETAFRALALQGEHVVGMVSLEVPSHPRRRHAGSLWLAVAPDERRRGIGKRLLGAAVDAGDRWFGLSRIALDVQEENRAAMGLLESFGFESEAVRRGGDVLRAGVAGDALAMARLRPGFTRGTPMSTRPPPPRGERVPRLRIRPIGLQDAADMARISTADAVKRGTLQLPSVSAASWRQKLASNAPGIHHLLGAEVEGQIVAFAGLHGNPNPRRRHVYGLGMSVLEGWQGRGIGSRLMDALLDLGDRWLSARRIELEVFMDNEHAIRLYERAGFQREGVLRASALRDGACTDTLLMGRVR
jgi:putative acetyltransferase